MDIGGQSDLVTAPITLVGEWKLVLLPEVIGFADLAVSASRKQCFLFAFKEAVGS